MASICEPFHRHQPSWSLFRSSPWQEREKSETSTALLSQPLCHPSTCFTSQLNPATESMHKSWREETRKGEKRREGPRRAFVLQSRENAETTNRTGATSCLKSNCWARGSGCVRTAQINRKSAWNPEPDRFLSLPSTCEQHQWLA